MFLKLYAMLHLCFSLPVCTSKSLNIEFLQKQEPSTLSQQHSTRHHRTQETLRHTYAFIVGAFGCLVCQRGASRGDVFYHVSSSTDAPTHPPHNTIISDTHTFLHILQAKRLHNTPTLYRILHSSSKIFLGPYPVAHVSSQNNALNCCQCKSLVCIPDRKS